LGDNADPVACYISRNVHRLHWTETQVALLAARSVNAGHGGARNFKRPTRPLEIVTIADAARNYGISETAVKRAAYILGDDRGLPEFIAALERGSPWLTLYGAHEKAHWSPDDQRKWLADHKHAIGRKPRVKRPPRPIPGLLVQAIRNTSEDELADAFIQTQTQFAKAMLKRGKRLIVRDVSRPPGWAQKDSP
jgi:hypothetical protein